MGCVQEATGIGEDLLEEMTSWDPEENDLVPSRGEDKYKVSEKSWSWHVQGPDRRPVCEKNQAK